MTTDRHDDPPRLRDEGPEALRKLVRARREGPSGPDIAKMSARLAEVGVLGKPSSPRTWRERTLAYSKLGGVVLLVAGGLLLTWKAVRTTDGPDAPVLASPAGERETERTSDAEPVSTSQPKLDAVSIDELPSATPPSVPTAGAAGSAARRSAKPLAGTAAATELELVQRAQSALASDPARSLAITSEHERAFPSGEFVQEREVIAVEALSRLGRKEEALRRARALLQRYPRTPYAARIEMVLEEAH